MALITAKRLTLHEAAEQLGLHTATLWRWAKAGVRGRKLPSLFIGGRRYILQDDLDRFIEDGRVGGGRDGN